MAEKIIQTAGRDAFGDYDDPEMRAHAKQMVFPIGAPNEAFAEFFVGNSYLAPLSTEQVGVYNVTFEPGCRNNWHIHHADHALSRVQRHKVALPR